MNPSWPLIFLALLFGCARATLISAPSTNPVTTSTILTAASVRTSTLVVPSSLTPVPTSTFTASPTKLSTPTRTPQPSPTLTPVLQLEPSVVLDLATAIDYARYVELPKDELAVRMCSRLKGADSVSVTFPGGDKGTLVILDCGFSLGTYKMLFRVKGSKAELVENDLDTYTSWGMTTLDSNNRVGIQSADLLVDSTGQNIPLLELVGWQEQGTGIWETLFQIIRIKDSGIDVIFEGPIHFVGQNFIPGDWDYSYQYDYVAVQGDRNKQIIKSGDECKT
jgi:hypothetical protein